MEERQLCVHCYANYGKVPYETFTGKTTGKIRGVEVSYIEKYAVCKICGHRIYIPELEDGNMKRLEEAYWKIEV